MSTKQGRLDLDSPQAQKERQEALQQAKTATKVSNALKEGQLPATGQITNALDSIEASEALHDAARGMSVTGKTVVADTERVMRTMRDYMVEKNDEDNLQRAIMHSKKAAEEMKKLGISEKIQTNVAGATDDNTSTLQLSKQALDHAIQVGKLLLTSEEYRDLLRELYFALRDAFARAAPGDTSTIQKNLDQATYIAQDALGTEKPIVTEQHLRHKEDNPDETKQRKKTEEMARKTKETGDVKSAMQQAPSPRDEVKKNLKQATVDTIDKEGSNLPNTDEIKETASDYQDKARHTLANLELTEENRRQLADRFTKILGLLEKNPNYRQSVDDLIALVSTIGQRHTNLAQATQSQIQETPAMREITEARRHIRLLFEQMAGGRSLQPLFDHLNDMWKKTQRDQHAHNYLHELRNFLEHCLKTPTCMQKQQNKEKLDHLINKGQSVLVEPYRSHLNSISHEIDEYLKAVSEDRTNQRLFKDVETLFSNAMLGPDGKLTVKPELARDLALLIRRLFHMLRFLPLPRVETHGDDMDLTLDNIVIYCGELLPNQIDIRTETNITVEDEQGKSNIHNTIHVTIEKIYGEVRDMVFEYHRKKLPEVQDSGIMTANFMDGEGMRMDLVFVTPKESDPEQNVKLASVNTNTKNLKTKFKETGHDALYTIISPIVNSMARSEIDKMISETVHSFFQSLDQQIGDAKSGFQNLKLAGGNGGKCEQQHEQSPAATADPHGRREVPKYGA